MTAANFDEAFRLLTGNQPFPWQQALYRELLVNNFPDCCDIPTGLGKTAVVAIWLLALAHHGRDGHGTAFPRRLIYVVNRRTVVDQVTHEAERIRERLLGTPDLQPVVDSLRELGALRHAMPWAISTLRGQFADNAEWRIDPARPSLIIGTVDMIGSRLLFGGYGCGFKSRPLHAGFLGQDALLVHDEAHLEPAFQELVAAIQEEQIRGKDFRRMRVIALTATTRSSGKRFQLSSDDEANEEVKRRIEARKGIGFYPIGDKRRLADAIVERALERRERGEAILVFLRELEQVAKVIDRIRKTNPVQLLTGTLRGLERDALVRTDPVFARFLPGEERSAPTDGGKSVYLVCTSAGEVGVNISADHLVCDLTPFDSMVQRFGRVNRFGQGDAMIDIVHLGPADGPSQEPEQVTESPPTPQPGSETSKGTLSEYNEACDRTLSLLRRLPMRHDGRRDGSPAALSGLPMSDRVAAFTPSPKILPSTDVLFDAWSLTSKRGNLPGRPAVAPWLHGVAEWQPPETQVAWRQEVQLLGAELRERHDPEDLLEDYPLKPHELLRDRSDRVHEKLKLLAEAHSDAASWVIAGNGPLRVMTLGDLASEREDLIADATVVLPPSVGGLANGTLDGKAAFDSSCHYDVADEWADENGRRRQRVWDDEERPSTMRRIRTIDTAPAIDQDEAPEGQRLWHWFVRPLFSEDDGSQTASQQQTLRAHLGSAERFADALVIKLGLEGTEATAVKLAAKWHDLGKARAVWQRSIGNRDYPERVLAKSGATSRALDINGYRHELGTLVDLVKGEELANLQPEASELLQHLVAAHHGRARPHFPTDEAFDPEHSEQAVVEILRAVPRRFARMQRKYGRWGLAYLESLVRASDTLASLPEELATDLLVSPCPVEEERR